MADDVLIEVFNQCVIRLEQGETIDDCADAYPQYENDLRVMLTATRIPQRAQAADDEVAQAQARVERRFEQALAQPVTIHRSYPWQRVASIVLILLFIGSLLTTGVVVAAQDSLPGDNLYGVKRFSEQVRLSFASDTTELESEFAQRRIDEINRLFELEREIVVQFVGRIEDIDESSLQVAGLRVELAESLRTIEVINGMRVQVMAQTQRNQSLLATDIRILDVSDISPQPNITSTPTMTLTQTATVTPTLPATSTPIPTEIRVTSTEQIRPTSRPTLTDTPAQRPTLTATIRPAEVTAQAQLESPTETATCNNPPSGWTTYTIKAGDTPSGVAVGTGLSLDDFYSANCDLNPRFIIGDVVYVPYEPRFAITPTDVQRTPTANTIITAEALERPTEVQQEPSRPTATPEREDDDDDDNQSRRGRNNDDGGDNSGGRGR